MRKKIISLCCAFLLLGGLFGISSSEVQAEEQAMIEGSYLTQEKESIGFNTGMSRGKDLLTGYSKVVRLGPELLYAGGSTIAAQVVDEVGISVIVERAQEGDDHWDYYDSWQMKVEGDYYYRVRCSHSANSDMSSSFTDGVYIPEAQILPGIPEIG